MDIEVRGFALSSASTFEWFDAGVLVAMVFSNEHTEHTTNGLKFDMYNVLCWVYVAVIVRCVL